MAERELPPLLHSVVMKAKFNFLHTHEYKEVWGEQEEVKKSLSFYRFLFSAFIERKASAGLLVCTLVFPERGINASKL